MTSLRLSSSPRTPAELLALLPEVGVEVAEQAFFAWAEPCDQPRFDELLAQRDHPLEIVAPWWHVHVGFTGVLAGSLEVQMPRELARDLGLAMIGGDPDHPLTDAELDDVAGEVANMLCGALLTRADRRLQFELQPPRVSHRPAAKQESSDPRLLFCLNDRPVAVRFDAWETWSG